MKKEIKVGDYLKLMKVLMGENKEILTIVTLKECIFYEVPKGTRALYLKFEQDNFKVKDGRPIGNHIYEAFHKGLSPETRNQITEIKRLPMDVGKLETMADLAVDKETMDEISHLDEGQVKTLKKMVKVEGFKHTLPDVDPKKVAILHEGTESKSFWSRIFKKK